MDYKNRESAGYSDREIRHTQSEVGGTGQRALRPVAYASSAFIVRPSPSLGPFSESRIPWLTSASGNWVTGGGGLRPWIGARRAIGIELAAGLPIRRGGIVPADAAHLCRQ